MIQRLDRWSWWRLGAVLMLLFIFIQAPVPRAQAEGAVVVAVTDDAGTPLAGAEVAIYGAAGSEVDTEDAVLVPGDEPLAGPQATDADGLTTFSDLPEGERLFAVQTAAPDGYVPAADPVALDLDASAADDPPRIDLVATVAMGVVEAIVAGAESGAPLEGATVAAYTMPDPATGLRGTLVGEAVTGPEGIARFDLRIGTYIIAITAPAPGFIAPGSVADQPITISMPVGGQRDYQTLVFELRPEPPEPENTPTPDPPTATPAPPPDPPTEAPDPTATSTPVPPPAPDDAVITVTGLFCISALQFNSVAYYQVGVDGVAESFVDNQVLDCRLATEAELAFTLIDPHTGALFDDEVVARGPSGPDGTVSLSVPVPESGLTLLLGEEGNLAPSAPFIVVPGDAVSLVAVNYVLPPAGNLTVRTVDAETSAIAAGGCFELIATTTEDEPYLACDADDGATDGRTRFIDIPNGAYTLNQSNAAFGFAPAPDQAVEIQGRSVDMAVSADALGAIDIRSRRCRDAAEPIALTAAEPSRRGISGDGTDVGMNPATPMADGCEPVAAEVVITPAGGEPIAIATGEDGRAVPVPMAPTVDTNVPHLVQIADTDTSVSVEVQPGAVTVVTVTLAAD